MKTAAQLRAILDGLEDPTDVEFIDLDEALRGFDYVARQESDLREMVAFEHPRGWHPWIINRTWRTFGPQYVANIREYLRDQATREGMI